MIVYFPVSFDLKHMEFDLSIRGIEEIISTFGVLATEVSIVIFLVETRMVDVS